MKLQGWGRYPIVEAPECLDENLERATRKAVLSRGLGRSYGDASLPVGGAAAGSRLADRILDFDPSSGRLHAEAGLSLRTLSWTFWPRGWSSPVLPGTAYLTLGGMVAADVHGKEHHVHGTFGAHVEALRMRLADGSVLWTDRAREPELFRATLGGMGLTGHVLEVVVALVPIPTPWIVQETERFPDLKSFLGGLERAAADWPFTVGWIDCLKAGRSMGRGILYRGRWASRDEAPAAPPSPRRRLAVPFDAPSAALNRWSVAGFNEVLYRKHGAGVRRVIAHPEDFFHPLDKVRHWNRGYGRRGFTQYQCVVPSREGAARVLSDLVAAGAASFLCVLKDCGLEGEGMLSFPRPGTSIAVDLPIRDETRALVDRLNARVIDEGGRVYLAKDTFTRSADYRAMDSRVDDFLAVRRRVDPLSRLQSMLSRRLEL
ncbi:MAG: FAD-binding oxidoreductase [Acidobacteriota bacterium]